MFQRIKTFLSLSLVCFAMGQLSTTVALGASRANAISLSQNWADFGEIQQGELAVIPVQLTNTSTSPQVLESVHLEGDDMVFSVNSLCAGILAPGTACTLEIEFFPQDFWGDFSGQIRIQTKSAQPGTGRSEELELALRGRASPAY
jgi:hypothetical protein